jgi:hypothetical protein
MITITTVQVLSLANDSSSRTGHKRHYEHNVTNRGYTAEYQSNELIYALE